MTNKDENKTHPTSGEAKKAGWFSRRHSTNEAHVNAQEARLEPKNRPKQKWVGGKINEGGHWVHETREEV